MNDSDIVAAGVEVLRIVGSRLRGEAAVRSHDSGIWLAIRDVEGLADRLVDVDQSEWEGGFASFWTNGQDVAVLDELVAGEVTLPSEGLCSPASPDEREALARLRDVLARYQRCG